ncbi:TetR/AcrR family transcriptional regulator [Actinoplanes sp. N902-109]|uniref:TetR/AcrR family transcriptional regulator n=1 Tax=Actinoplanes sp. (strain N902-109) TaxID=649831 RepID=UPI0003295E3F|nr:TetR/AcrR family transcriptional regulator [Actinoplanes sp. N902-109]AGL17005.1 TetR family transcriptional regulator [Actinoplanes sp. N902-109]
MPAAPGSTGRPRSDAQRNREKLLTAARETIAAADGPIALEAVARRAGVGIGTLYRHFPSREELIEAVYAAELDDLATSATTLLAELPPELALRQWMNRYAAFSTTKRGMLDTLRSSIAAGRIAPRTRELITAAFAAILEAGARAGTLRDDIHPDDATMMLHGIFLTTGTGDVPGQTDRLLDLMADALATRR